MSNTGWKRELPKDGRQRSTYEESRVDPCGNMVCRIFGFIGRYVSTLISSVSTKRSCIHATTGTIVATLFSPIGAYFNRSHQSSYIGTSYLLSVCCFTPLYGRLSDILGRRGAMLLALSLFGSGTFLCGIAPSMNVFIAARVIAGMGGGGSVPQFHIICCWL